MWYSSEFFLTGGDGEGIKIEVRLGAGAAFVVAHYYGSTVGSNLTQEANSGTPSSR